VLSFIVLCVLCLLSIVVILAINSHLDYVNVEHTVKYNTHL